jgi:hypothetical protein
MDRYLDAQLAKLATSRIDYYLDQERQAGTEGLMYAASRGSR